MIAYPGFDSQTTNNFFQSELTWDKITSSNTKEPLLLWLSDIGWLISRVMEFSQVKKILIKINSNLL